MNTIAIPEREKTKRVDRTEPVQAVLTDDREVCGELTAFVAAEERVEITAQPGMPPESVPFASLRWIKFTRPVDPAVGVEAFRKHGIRVEALPQRSPFSLTFTDARVYGGELYGYGAALGGLGIYLAGDAQLATRMFVPAGSIESFMVGERLGKLLLDRGQISANGLEIALERQRLLSRKRLGQLLLERRLVSRADLEKALSLQGSRPIQPLGELLIEMGALTTAQLEMALGAQRADRRKPIGELLVDLEMIDRATLHRVLAEKVGVPYVDLRRYDFDSGWAELAPYPVCKKHGIVPLYRAGSALTVATSNPLDMDTLNRASFALGKPLLPVLATAEDIAWALERHHERPLYEVMDRAKDEEPPVSDEEAENAESLAARLGDEGLTDTESGNATMVRLVNRIILDAQQQNASDIHFDPGNGRDRLRIRLRRDGALTDYLSVPARFRPVLVSRIKIMANLDISEHRRAQDGKIEFKRSSGKSLELRVACIPTQNGVEALVLRLLSAATPRPLAEIGLSPDAFARLRAMSERPYGLIVVCGPTGSGKTTTLHSVLAHLNTPHVKIWTAEDPVEITQAGLTQVQVHPKIGWTFATALKSFLRADPDVIMVGEVRDAETARIVVEASLTGHLVMTTLHTNSAPESIARLIDIGVDPFNFADALLGVVAQRLARRLCPRCTRLEEAVEADVAALASEYCAGSDLRPEAIIAQWHRDYAVAGALRTGLAIGCKECGDTGFSGRVALYELLSASPTVKTLIQQRATAEQLRVQGIHEGMRTLKHDGIEKVLQGLTTIEHVRAVAN